MNMRASAKFSEFLCAEFCRIGLVSSFFFLQIGTAAPCLPALKLEGAVLYLVPGLNTFSLIYMYLEIYSEFSQFYLSHFAITPGLNTIGIPGIVIPSSIISTHFLTLTFLHPTLCSPFNPT